MKKILTILASTILLMSAANAQVSMGISGIYLDVEASGTETLKTTAVKSSKTHSDEAVAAEIFIEKQTAEGLSVGLAIIPMSAEVGSSSTQRTDKLTSGTVTGTQKASAEFSMHTTVYALVPMGSNGFYAKLGAGFVDVESTESFKTGASYGDETLNFATIGFGVNRDLANGTFVRAEAAFTDYEEFELKSTGSDAVSTINGDLETLSAKISIGKSF
jgi:hypothetical protein